MLNFMGKLLNGLTATLVEWGQRQRAYAELSSLDDRSLADIGITRSEIPFVLSHASAADKPGVAAAPANSNFQHAA